MERLDNSNEKIKAIYADNALATPMDRFLAALIDGVLMGIVGRITFVGSLVALAYFFTKDTLPFLDGQSIGKRLMKIKVINAETGEEITENYGAGVIRVLSLIIPIFNIVDAVMVFNTDRLRFGDKWAKTKVIKLESL
jgi:uncharacterized RDD family membrane protein YckC